MKKFSKKTTIIVSVLICVIMLAGILLSFVPMTAGSKTFLSLSGGINVSTDMMGGMYGEYDILTENPSESTKIDSMQKVKRVFEKFGYKNVNVYIYGSKLRVEVSYPRGSKSYEKVYGELGMVAGGSFKLSSQNPSGSTGSTGTDKEDPIILNGNEHVESVKVYTNNNVKYISINFNKEGQEVYKQICGKTTTIYLSLGENYNQQINASGVSDYSSLTLSDEKYENLISLEQRVTIGCMGLEINPDTPIVNTMSANTIAGKSSPEETGFSYNTTSVLMIVTYLVVLVSLIAIFAARFGLYAVVVGISMLFNSFIFLGLMNLMPSIEIGIAGIVALTLGTAIIYTYSFIFAENVKKQYDLGKSFRASLETAFKRMLPSTIISNVALFISALIIFAFSFGELTSGIVIFAILMALSLLTNLLIIPFLVKVGISYKKIDVKLFMLPKRAIGFETNDDDAKEEE